MKYNKKMGDGMKKEAGPQQKDQRGENPRDQARCKWNKREDIKRTRGKAERKRRMEKERHESDNGKKSRGREE